MGNPPATIVPRSQALTGKPLGMVGSLLSRLEGVGWSGTLHLTMLWMPRR